jgi:serine O-acetyltransferase
MLPFMVRLFGGFWKLKDRCQRSRFLPLKRFFIWIYRLYQDTNASGIAWNSTFLGAPCTPHGIKGIFVSGESVISENCVIFQQVTIGSNAPVIGKNCYIAAGAKIIGAVRVGDNVRIGANAVVFRDIPDNSVVVVGEQKVIQKGEGLDNRFYSFGKEWAYYKNGKWIPVSDRDTLDALFSRFPKTRRP